VVTIDLHYITDRQERFDLKISKLKLLREQRHLHALEVSENIPKINFKVNYPFKHANENEPLYVSEAKPLY